MLFNFLPHVEIFGRKFFGQTSTYVYSRRIQGGLGNASRLRFYCNRLYWNLSHSFRKQKVLHASRYSIFLCVSRSLFLLYFHRVVYFISPSLSLSLFLPLFLSLSHSLTRSLARSLSNTTNRSKRFTRYNHVFHIYHAVAYNKIRHRLQQQQHTLTRTAQTHVFFLLLLLFSSSSFFTPRPFHSHEKYNIQNIYHEGCMRHSWNYNFSYFHYLLLPPSLSLTLALALSLTLTFSFLLYFTIFSFHFSILSIINIIIYIYISSHDFSFIFFSLLTLSSSLVPSHSRILLSMYN